MGSHQAHSKSPPPQPQGAATGCGYFVEGRMVRTCGSATDVAYDGANVSATNNGIWHFLHGPGTDDPLIGMGQQPGGANVATKEFYWVTDGQGRQYALAEATGYWDAELDPDNWPGFQQAGGITDATGYKAGRDQGSSVPGVSYFRNRIYDQQSGQWTQEDPLGVAGGINLYQYAGGNPVAFTDPWGLKACPGIEGTDQNSLDDCPEGTPEYYAAREAKGEGSSLWNNIAGTVTMMGRSVAEHVGFSATLGNEMIETDSYGVVNGVENGNSSVAVTGDVPSAGFSANVLVGRAGATAVNYGLGKHLGMSFEIDKGRPESGGSVVGVSLNFGLATPQLPVSMTVRR